TTGFSIVETIVVVAIARERDDVIDARRRDFTGLFDELLRRLPVVLQYRRESWPDPGDILDRWPLFGNCSQSKVAAILDSQRIEVGARQTHAELCLRFLDVAIGERRLQIRQIDWNTPQPLGYTFCATRFLGCGHRAAERST